MRHDRLAWLAACHGVLRQYAVRSLDEYRRASPERLDELHRYRAMIRDLVDQGHPDVLLALWPPVDVTWLVARLAIDPYARLLSVSKGPHGGPGGRSGMRCSRRRATRIRRATPGRA